MKAIGGAGFVRVIDFHFCWFKRRIKLRLQYLSLGILDVVDFLLQKLLQQIVFRFFLESESKNLLDYVFHGGRFIITEYIQSVIQFCLSSLIETLVAVLFWVDIDSWEAPTIKHINKEVAEGNYVVSPTSIFEIQLVETCENHVAAECFDFWFGNVFPSRLFNVWAGKTIVYKANGAVFKNIDSFKNI